VVMWARCGGRGGTRNWHGDKYVITTWNCMTYIFYLCLRW
jgi:hypothetical protein